ncbi:hypothetical protein LOK49_LG06G00615 [Camellia lanceoleosa]|uniref:Uncharacterized protein n=1 Tax=Camellia lanceoleosa TaxID=1840588 RepID=A0ACC0HG22_9ERIC|nr:hypothetical protein LOK49_LG06G00615 [Camellia lanceoleosa]
MAVYEMFALSGIRATDYESGLYCGQAIKSTLFFGEKHSFSFVCMPVVTLVQSFDFRNGAKSKANEQGYKEKLVDNREEILRKRRVRKLPGDTTSVLKAWW